MASMVWGLGLVIIIGIIANMLICRSNNMSGLCELSRVINVPRII